MKTKNIAAAIMFAAMTSLTGVASAHDQTGVGIGGVATLAGATGADLMYWINPDFAVEGLIGMGLGFPPSGSGMGGGGTTFSLQLAGGVHFVIAKGDATNLSFGGRLNLGILAAGSTGLGIGIEGPLRVEHWLGDNFSISCQVGPAIGIAIDGAYPFGGGLAGGGTAAGVNFARAYLVGNAGFTYYFDGAATQAPTAN